MNFVLYGKINALHAKIYSLRVRYTHLLNIGIPKSA